MDSLLMLPPGGFLAVDLALRIAFALVVMTGVLLGLATMCVGRSHRFPLILGSVALLGAAWIESGIARAWQGAFELAGSSYCVTGLPLAGGDRVVAWALGIPALLFCLGFAQLDRSSKAFRNLCLSVMALAILGPFFDFLFLIGFLACVIQLRGLVIPPGRGADIRTAANRVALMAMAAGILLTEAGHFHLLPLGTAPDSILVRGELIRSLGDVLTLVLPGAALLVCILNLPEKDGRVS
jgi:hypothetical protein